ncbi:MAG: hypothetical protein H6Q84_2232, partial [Deltaproteobacteria bacterium]|nr:hypothetical protein [Deltaproteobacteria bacterium]
GGCHPYQLARVRSGLMFTNAGMIRNIQRTWEGEDGATYSVQGGDTVDAGGKPFRYRPVAELENLSGELYRKFCSRCHLGIEVGDAYGSSHAAGCAACHFPFNDTATYEGGDRTVRGKWPFSESHRLEPLPPTAACARCHNRSGRIALSYQGLYDGNNGLVPTSGGEPGPVNLSGGRNAIRIVPDVHAAAGMECIDCHTSRDVMGDGYGYRNMYRQVEIACEDCHGGAEVPKYRVITRENDEAVRESRRYPAPMRPGDRAVLTARGRAYSNVFVRDGAVFVQGKRSGKIFRSQVVTGTPEHTVVGHERLECYACHSLTAVQCYGCHTRYDRREKGEDFVRREDTPGAFSETEDYRTLYPFPLAVNQRGRISPVTPGCQTFVTVVDEQGNVLRDEEVARFRGKRQLRFAPFYSHNTGKKAVGCRECHANPAFLGFGQTVAEEGSFDPTLLCGKSPDRALDGFLALRNGKVRPTAAIVRENSRALSAAEIRRVFRANLCITCHDKARDKDGIYGRRLDYGALRDDVHRRLLAGD